MASASVSAFRPRKFAHHPLPIGIRIVTFQDGDSYSRQVKLGDLGQTKESLTYSKRGGCFSNSQYGRGIISIIGFKGFIEPINVSNLCIYNIAFD